VETARINLRYTRVLSPISGRIGRSAVTEGALVTANPTTALATVQQLDHDLCGRDAAHRHAAAP
jgi:membrane fusion protein (multidrug efflux system)